jgi:hypothetical protein
MRTRFREGAPVAVAVAVAVAVTEAARCGAPAASKFSPASSDSGPATGDTFGDGAADGRHVSWVLALLNHALQC